MLLGMLTIKYPNSTENDFILVKNKSKIYYYTTVHFDGTDIKYRSMALVKRAL